MRLATIASLFLADTAQPQDSRPSPVPHKSCIVIVDLAKNHYQRNDDERCAERLSPWSTFKIPNSLISLELGIVPNTTQVTKWDGVTRERPEWNRDQTLATAFSVSAVWYYQRLARETGEKRMRDYLQRIHYGNEDISGGIDRFWLGNSLLISADEQVDFLRRLIEGQLPFSTRTTDLLKDIMVVSRTSDSILRGKTGMGGPSDSRLNWFVGYLERGSQVYIFATNIEGRGISDPLTARRMTEDRLHQMNLR